MQILSGLCQLTPNPTCLALASNTYLLSAAAVWSQSWEVCSHEQEA